VHEAAGLLCMFAYVRHVVCEHVTLRSEATLTHRRRRRGRRA
jgi:hypothetical protein